MAKTPKPCGKIKKKSVSFLKITTTMATTMTMATASFFVILSFFLQSTHVVKAFTLVPKSSSTTTTISSPSSSLSSPFSSFAYPLFASLSDDNENKNVMMNDNYDDDTKLWSMIESITVKTLTDNDVSLGEIIPSLSVSSNNNNNNVFILSCLSHFGDFNAWEMTQQYITAIDENRIPMDCPIILVGIGSVSSAQQFAKDLELEKYMVDNNDNNNNDSNINKRLLLLVADETGSVSNALGCYRGWLPMDIEHKQQYPFTDINPYIKLFGMIFGFGSPGTIPKVLIGYTGDNQNILGSFGRKWVVNALLQGSQMGRFPQLTTEAFDGVPESSSLRPFELATLRLQTGLHIVWNWSKLGPKDGDLFTRMGGTFLFQSSMSSSPSGTGSNSEVECLWKFYDKGILVYASIDEICKAATTAVKGGQCLSEDTVIKEAKPKAAKTKEEVKTIVEEEEDDAKAKAKVIAEEGKAKLKAEQETKAKAEEEARVQAENEAKAKAEEEEEEAKAKAEEVARLKAAEEEAKAKAEEEARIKAEEEEKVAEEARLKAEEEEKKVQAQTADEAKSKAEEEERRLKKEIYLFQRRRLETQFEIQKKVSMTSPPPPPPPPPPVAAEEEETRLKKESYLFQRRRLEAQFEIQKKVAITSPPPVDSEKEERLKKESYLFQRRRLEAQLEIQKKVPMTSPPPVDSEKEERLKKDNYLFQRRRLEAQLEIQKKVPMTSPPPVDGEEEEEERSKKESYLFQRRRLEAQFEIQRKVQSTPPPVAGETAVTTDSPAKEEEDTINETNLPETTAAPDMEGKQKAYSFQRRLLQAQLETSKKTQVEKKKSDDADPSDPSIELLEKKKKNKKNKNKNNRSGGAQGFSKS